MTVAAVSSHIDIADLRVGMHVHLEGGWLAHPFPLSSFKIASAEQIATLRSLGLQRVRWSLEKSDFAAPASPGSSAAARPSTAAVDPAQATREAKKAALAAQRADLARCERQFAEAAQVCRAITEQAATDPRAAGVQCTALAQAFVDRMIGDGGSCIRMLAGGHGDRAATHALNVTVISMLLGQSFGVSPAEMIDLGVGALLHDIGKLDLPERVRHRDEHAGTAETQAYRQHVAHGVAQGRRMGLAPNALLVIAQHHEHADGSGFPGGVGSDRMSIPARVVALVDRYDNLCNPHVPAKAMTPHEALSLLFTQGRTRYDTTLLGGFIRMLGVYPPGSTVQLTDDRHALVVSVNASRPLKPRVLVHDRGVPAGEALLLDLQREPVLGIRRSVKPLALPAETYDYLAPKPRIAYFFEPAGAVDSTL